MVSGFLRVARENREQFAAIILGAAAQCLQMVFYAAPGLHGIGAIGGEHESIAQFCAAFIGGF